MVKLAIATASLFHSESPLTNLINGSVSVVDVTTTTDMNYKNRYYKQWYYDSPLKLKALSTEQCSEMKTLIILE